MSRWGRWALVLAPLVLALALPAGGVLTLQCDTSGPAVMSCCQSDMADCGHPGMTQDCCRMVPANGSGVAIASPGALHERGWDSWSLAPVPGVRALVALLPTAPESQRNAERSPALHALSYSSRTTVLRI